MDYGCPFVLAPPVVVEYLRLAELVALCQTSWSHLALCLPDIHPRRYRLTLALSALVAEPAAGNDVVQF